MRRAPIVLATTAAGLAALLSYRTVPPPVLFGKGLPSQSITGLTTPSSSGGTPGHGSTTTTPSGTGTGGTGGTTTTSPSTSTRSASGQAVNYSYGIISVEVTVEGKKITKVGIASLDDGGNFRSVSIDEQSIPILEQQALQAQNANIAGVSGATYTSQGFAQSLQSALSSLGLS
ncbi:MAG TPA: FMN-binding protein [Acidimicrobiales bacterium]|nr:FMN-binding protein [Acidimicrobiales bacterium]